MHAGQSPVIVFAAAFHMPDRDGAWERRSTTVVRPSSPKFRPSNRSIIFVVVHSAETPRLSSGKTFKACQGGTQKARANPKRTQARSAPAPTRSPPSTVRGIGFWFFLAFFAVA